MKLEVLNKILDYRLQLKLNLKDNWINLDLS
jgi:hypothetical protein